MNQAPTTAVEAVWKAQHAWPPGLIVLAVVLAILLIAWLYWHERGQAGKLLRGSLVVLRCTLLLSVLWMLQGWSIQRFETSQPELVMVLDRSSSMETVDQASLSTTQTRAELIANGLRDLPLRQRKAIQSQYRSQWYQIADGLELFQEDWTSLNELSAQVIMQTEQSRLGDGLRRIVQRHGSGGAAAIVLLSDGINTSGSVLLDAAREARAAAVPVHAVVVGRETAIPDVRIVDVLVERDIFLGDSAIVDISIAASDTKQSTFQVLLRDAETGRVLDQRSPGLNDGQATLQLQCAPDRLGTHQLSVEVAAVAGEQDEANNKASVSINVQDRIIKVLLVFARPSYEFRFLKHFLERTQRTGAGANATFDVDCVLQDADADYVLQDSSALRLVPADDETLSTYDAFIFGDCQPELISRSAQNSIRDSVLTRGAGCVFVFGSEEPTQSWLGWPLADLWPFRAADINSQSLSLQQSGAVESANVLWRWQPAELGGSILPPEFESTTGMSTWTTLPGFYSIASVGAIKPGAQVLAHAVAGRSESPVLVSQFAGAGRVVAQLTDETYLWTSLQGQDLAYQLYWNRLLRWLTRGRLSKNGESELRILPRRARFGETIRFSLVTQQPIDGGRFVVEDMDGNRQAIDMVRSSKTPTLYQSSLSNLAPGEYQAVWTNESEAQLREKFTVTAPPSEQANLTADREVMQQIAEISRGRYYDVADMSKLLTELPAGRRVRLGSLPPKPLWNHPLVAIGFITLLTLEWLLRRRGRML